MAGTRQQRWHPGRGPLVFHELPPPTGEEVADVARRSAERIKKVLRKHGRELDPEMEEVEAPEPAELQPIHEAQLLSYLKLSGRHVGLLINFNVKLLKSGIRRLVNELPE